MAKKNLIMWAIASVCVILILSLSGLYILKQFVSLSAKVAHAWKEGSITTTFISYATEVKGHSYFQFATLDQMELFERKDESSIGFGYIPLPDVIVEVRAPVQFTYYLDLKGRWNFVVENNVLYVLTPPIQFNKPAIDISKIDYTVKKGSVFRNEEKAFEELQTSITGLSIKRAKENIPLVKDQGRKQVEEFVAIWVKDQFLDGKTYQVIVLFPDESLPPSLSRFSKKSDE